MRDTSLLQQALGLTSPWTVSRSDFDPEGRRLDIQIDFASGSRFPVRLAALPTARCTTPSGRAGERDRAF